MDNDALKPKSIDKQEAILINRPIILGILGFFSFYALIWVALIFDGMSGGCFVTTILLTPWELIVGSLAIVFLILDLRKLRQRNESLGEGTSSKLTLISAFLNVVVLIGVLIGYFSSLC